MPVYKESYIHGQCFDVGEKNGIKKDWKYPLLIEYIKKEASFGVFDIEDIVRKKNTVDFLFSYHCMNENGYWDGYINFWFKMPIIGNQLFFKQGDPVGVNLTSRERRRYFDSHSIDYYYETITYQLESFFEEIWFNYRTGEVNRYPVKKEKPLDQDDSRDLHPST